MSMDMLDAESRTVIGPGTNVKLAFTVAIAAVISWGGWVTSELNTIKNVALSSSTSYTVVNTKMELLAQRVEMIEQRGSLPLQMLQKTVDKISEDFRIHEAKTANSTHP